MRLTLLFIALLAPPPEQDGPLRAVGRLDHPPIRESSGVVASRRHPGVFWVHNDSGNPPRLYAVRGDGGLIREYVVSVPNVDWEDVATDDRGRLYLGEIGNNGGRVPLRAVYRLDEPDPFVPLGDAPPPALKVDSATYYRFGGTPPFDAEGLAVSSDGRTALVVSKTFDGRDADVYELPLEPAAPLLRPAVPRKLGTLPGFTAPVTGADLRADGLLAVVSGREVAVYRRRDGAAGNWVRVGGCRFHGGKGVEAVAWSGADLVLTDEGRGVYRINEAAWRGRVERRAGRNGQ